MTKHLRYLQYILQHKWYVLVECWRRGLYWRGLVHDLSKLRPSEWFPYAESFYGPFGYNGRPASVVNAFDRAWLAHQHRNDHHWQHWVLREDSGAVKVLPMSQGAAAEMVCDWIGAGRAITGNPLFSGTQKWYLDNCDKVQLHDITREFVERTLRIEPFRRGYVDAYQDDCENCHFASVGATDPIPRSAPAELRAPDYIDEADADDYLAGCVAFYVERYGEDWRTAEFRWAPVLNIRVGEITAVEDDNTDEVAP